MIPSWFWHFGILKMSYPNGRKVWSIVYRWPRYFDLNHDHLSACDRWFQSERWGTSLDNLQLLWQVGGTEHHSERWETTDKAGNDDEIPPKDLFEEVWASFRTLRDHCRLCQWSLKVLNDALSHQPDKSCWRWLELVPKRSVVYSLPPTWQKQLQMIGAGPKMFWCLLSSTNLLLLISTSPSHLLSPPSTFWLMLCPTNLSKAVEDGQGWNHLSHADRWSWLRSKYLGQRYTILYKICATLLTNVTGSDRNQNVKRRSDCDAENLPGALFSWKLKMKIGQNNA